MSFYQYGLKTVNLPERPLIRAVNAALESFLKRIASITFMRKTELIK